MTTETIVNWKNVSLGYRESVVLSDVNLPVKKGSIVAVVGANGSGKSTLLKSVLDSSLLLSGEVLKGAGLKAIGYVPQRHALKAHFPLKVLDVVLMGTYHRCTMAGSPSKKEINSSREALDRTGMLDKEHLFYRDLSGGQQQRVLIARALAVSSPLMFLDEPCSGMDLPSENEILELLQKLNSEELSVVMVTHSLKIASIAAEVAIIHNGTLVFGEVSEMLSFENISKLYDIPASKLKRESIFYV